MKQQFQKKKKPKNGYGEDDFPKMKLVKPLYQRKPKHKNKLWER